MTLKDEIASLAELIGSGFGLNEDDPAVGAAELVLQAGYSASPDHHILRGEINALREALAKEQARVDFFINRAFGPQPVQAPVPPPEVG